MITFLSISIRNFMSVGNDPLEFNYQTGLYYVYGENYDVSNNNDMTLISNGSGKTVVLVDAPLFALYGKTQRKIKRNEIVNMQNGSECEVKLTFTKDGVEYIVERGLKPDKIIIYKDGVPESEEAKKRQANKIIEEEILEGISYEVFKNLIVLNGTSSKHFFEYGKNEKRTFINEVFRLGFLEYLQFQLTDEVKAKKVELEKLIIKQASKQEEIDRLKSLQDATESGEVVDIVGDLQIKIKEEQAKINFAKKQVDMIEAMEFKGNNEQFSNKIKFAQEKMNETSREIMQIDVNVSSLKNRFKSLKEEYFHTVQNDQCPKCTQPISQEVKNRLQAIIAQQGQSIQSEIDIYIKNRDELNNKILKMREWIDNANNAISNYNEHIQALQNSTILLTEYQKQFDNKPEPSQNVELIKAEVSKLEESYKVFCEEVEVFKKDYMTYKVCRDIVGGKNFYGYYISVFRNYLNKAINEYLKKMLSPHRVTFNNDLEADVYDGNLKYSSYENLSTGEKSKINLSLLLSFFDVLHVFHRMRTSLMVLDEVLDSGLDSVAIEMLNKLLKEKVKENSELGIYVVSHKSSETSFTDQEEIGKICFYKQNGFTQIKQK